VKHIVTQGKVKPVMKQLKLIKRKLNVCQIYKWTSESVWHDTSAMLLLKSKSISGGGAVNHLVSSNVYNNGRID
jgi:hypothetical protein